MRDPPWVHDRLGVHDDLQALVRERDELQDLHGDFFLLRVLRDGHAATRGDGRTVDDLSVDLGPGHEAEPGLADDDGLGRIAHALAGGGPGVEQRDLALDEQRLRLLRLEEQHARRVVRHGPHHLVERADARRGVDQRLHVLVEILAAVGEKALSPPVVRESAGGRLVGRAGAEELPVASVPAPAVEELGRLVPLLPGLGRSEVVVVLRLELLLVVGAIEGDLVPVHDVDVAIVRHAHQLALVAEHHLGEDGDDVVDGEVELELLDPGLQRLEVPAVVGHVGRPEHHEVPWTRAGVELEERLGHERVEGDDLGLDLHAELVVEVLLDEVSEYFTYSAFTTARIVWPSYGRAAPTEGTREPRTATSPTSTTATMIMSAARRMRVSLDDP